MNRPNAQDSEATDVGEQTLTPGVRPVTLRDRLSVLAAQPLAPKRNAGLPQKPCDHGLFDEVGRAQTDLCDLIAQSMKETKP